MSTPLATVGSIKVKLGLLVAASVAGGDGRSASSATTRASRCCSPFPVTVALALGVTQLLAVGMTSPLREMTEAARRMARGDYRGRVRAESADEVGELARAFNQMAAELATVDREQRALVATVSHELRTPLAGLTAVLENLADGVVPGRRGAPRGRRSARPGGSRDLVGDLLELSRVDAGVAPLRLGRGATWPRCWTRPWPSWCPPAGRSASPSTSPTGSTVRADRARLRQLVVNLLDNAVRHGPDRGTVRVRARRTTATAGGSRSPTRVRACRPPTASAPSSGSARSPTTRAARPPAAPASGLAIARWVATLHGGTVRFVDPPAGTTGAVLRVDLPLDPPGATSRRPGPAYPSPALSGGRHVRTRHHAPAPHRRSTVTRPPVIDPLFGRYWPDVPGSGRPVVLAALGVGVLAGLLIPYRDLGPGVLPRAARGRGHRVVGCEAPAATRSR